MKNIYCCCPICDKPLRKFKKSKNNEFNQLIYYETYAFCPRCKQYKYENINCNHTLWIKNKEYYGFYESDLYTKKIMLNISMCRLFYKIHKKIQKITKRY